MPLAFSCTFITHHQSPSQRPSIFGTFTRSRRSIKYMSRSLKTKYALAIIYSLFNIICFMDNTLRDWLMRIEAVLRGDSRHHAADRSSSHTRFGSIGQQISKRPPTCLRCQKPHVSRHPHLPSRTRNTTSPTGR